MTNNPVSRLLDLTSTQEFDRAAELEKLRRNVTVLFTDIKGSTAYFERFGDSAGLMMVFQINTLLSKCVERHGGRVIKTIGDSVMAAFEDQADAVLSAMEMQQAIAADNHTKPETHRVTVRIGLNHGLGFVKSNDVFGDVVNVASRVEGSANAEQILVSSNIHDALAPTNRFRFRHAGRFPLKGKTDASDLFEVIWQEPSGPALPESVAAGPQTKLRIVQLCKDATGRTFEIASKVTVIGRTAGEFTFPDDEYMQPTHARLLMESGQLFLQPMPSADSYFSLVASYRLQPGDVVSIGRQVLEFQENQAALAEASQIGKGLGELAAMLHNAVAEFISLKSDAKRYPVREQQTTFGRTKATFTFPTDTVMSRSHARVYHRGEDFFLEDLGSTNGTFVLARDKTPIPPGTVLSIGGQRLKIVREEERG